MRSDNIHDLMPDAPIITDDIRLELHRKYAQPYIFYKKYHNHIDCYCTACMHRFDVRRDASESDIYGYRDYMFNLNCEHDAVVECPICGEKAIARSEQMSRTPLLKWHMLAKWFVSEDGNVVHAVFGELCCGYGRRKPNSKELSISEMEQQYGGSEWYTRYVVRFAKNEEPMMIESNCFAMWAVQKVKEPYLRSGLYNFISSDFDDVPALKRSFLRYVLPEKLDIQSEVYSGTKIIEWLAMVQKYPIVETFCKCGGEQIIKNILDHKESYKRVLDFEADKLSKVFRCDNDTAAVLQKLMYKGELTLDKLKIRRLLERKYKKPMIEEMQHFNMSVRVFKDCVLPVVAATGISIQQYINYLKKQIEVSQYRCNTEWLVTIYRDYINECVQLGYDPRESIVGRPRNLNEAHRRNRSAISAIELEKERERKAAMAKGYINGFYKQWCKHYEYTNGVWSIIVPKSASEIVEEGKALSHCVAGYADRHINGKLTILFMRKNDDLSKSVYTIEMHGNQMMQVQGYHDRTPLTADAKDFFDKWLKWVRLSDKQKDKRKHKKESAA